MDDADFDDVEEEQDEEDELDPLNPEHAFPILEREYTKIYAEMEQDPELAVFADSYAKIFEFLYKSREHEQELQWDKLNLQDKLKNQDEKLETTMKIMKSDEVTIGTLKDEVQKSHRLIDNAHAREQAAQEIIDNLRKQIASLNAEIDFKNKMAQGELEENPQVAKHREGLEREKVKLMSEVSKLSEKLNNALAYQEELERRTSLTDIKINEVNVQLEETNAEVERFKRHKDKLESDLEEQRQLYAHKLEEVTNLTDTVNTNVRLIAKYETTLKENTASSLKCFKELEGWHMKYTKIQDEVDVLNYHNDVLKKDYYRAMQDVKAKDEERQHLNIDISKLSKQKEQAENKTKHVEGEKYNVQVDRDKLRLVITCMERDIDIGKKQADSDKRTIDTMARERDIINKNLMRQQAVARDHIKLIKVQEQGKRKLEFEIDGHIIEKRSLNKQISYLEKERDRVTEELLDMTHKVEETIDDVKLKKAEVFDLKKSLAENAHKMRTQQNLFDAVRADRNALQKSLQESTAEKHELKGKLKTTTHQTEQLKEDISMKEQLLIKEETILRKIIKEKENMKIELNASLDNIRALKADIAEMKTEEKRLHKVIVTSDRTVRAQVKTITQLMNERDVLGSQLVRRNDEISLLYEKIKILQTTLHRGEAQYDQRLQDIKLLKVEIKRLRQEKSLLTNSIKNMNDLKQEVFHLERDLTKERLKTKALEDELQNPMNIHRWRKLEGSDPEVFELLQKISLLQKRLLQAASQAVDKERQLKETEQLYTGLRQVISKQPGPEVQNRLIKTQKALTQNISRMKCLCSELNMTEEQLKEYKLNLERMTQEYDDVKKKFIQAKKQRTKDVQTIKELTTQLTTLKSHQLKTTGIPA